MIVQSNEGSAVTPLAVADKSIHCQFKLFFSSHILQTVYSKKKLHYITQKALRDPTFKMLLFTSAEISEYMEKKNYL